ncbi:MAG: hypothetical protein LBN21_13460 [Treponema sp.]|jgi:hypothetical protein|nr:hypothetical protein [Treponema sp.]
MAKSSSKVSVKFAVILAVALLLVGYVVGSAIPAPIFNSENFLGAFGRPGGNHRR